MIYTLGVLESRIGDLLFGSSFGPRSPLLYTEPPRNYLDSQVAGNNRPLYPKVDHYWFKVAHNYEPLALQVRNERVLGLVGLADHIDTRILVSGSKRAKTRRFQKPSFVASSCLCGAWGSYYRGPKLKSRGRRLHRHRPLNGPS